MLVLLVLALLVLNNKAADGKHVPSTQRLTQVGQVGLTGRQNEEALLLLGSRHVPKVIGHANANCKGPVPSFQGSGKARADAFNSKSEHRSFNSFNSKSKHIQLKEQAHSTHSTQRASTFNLKSKHIQLIQLKEQAQLIQLKEQAPAAQPSPARLMGRCQCRRAHMLH